MAGLGPQAFYEDVIDPAALTIHTNVDIVVFEYLSEFFARELAPLITVEYLRCAVLSNRLLQGLDAEVWRHAVRYPMSQHPAARPVDNRH